MATKTENADVVMGAAAAGHLLTALRPRLQDRGEKILKALVQGHIDGTLTESLLRSGIAAIAELRALERDLASEAGVGHSTLLRDIATGRPGR